MRRTILAWRMIIFAGLILFVISACASRQTASQNMTDDTSAKAAAEKSSEDSLTRQPTSEEQRLQDEAARRQFETERNRFIYEDIFFGKNQFRLDENARRELSWKAQWLTDHPDIRVRIEGHTDENRTAEDNLALGARRAGEVKSFFLRRNIARERLSVISFGREQPVATGEGEEVRAKNRRVRTLIIE